MTVPCAPVVTFAATAADGTFQLALTSNVGVSLLTGLQPGGLYAFDLQQDATGGHAFRWPANCPTFPAMPTQPNARLVVSAVCYANFRLYPYLPSLESLT